VPLLGLNLKGSPLGVILPVAIWGFSILVMSEFMKEIPREIEEAARIDGVGEIRMLWTIVLPLCKPVLGVITIFGFMMIWNQYLLPLIAANQPSDYTLTVALSFFRSDRDVGPGVLLAGALIALLPSLIVYLLMQKSMIRGITSGALKG
jgi:multiple sugar transport system permease protein